MTEARRKSIFITGAASGMGLATALLFAKRGWFVGAYDVNRAALDALATQIDAEASIIATLDVTDPKAFEAAFTTFSEATGGTLDLMFNNAGIAAGGLLDEQPWEELKRIDRKSVV